jgi:hypothetical protein
MKEQNMKHLCVGVVGLVACSISASCAAPDRSFNDAGASSGADTSTGAGSDGSGTGGVADAGGHGGEPSCVNCGSCVAVVCTASDQCHAAGACDPGTGMCSNPLEPDGATCDDGDAGTSSEVCTGGVCVDPGIPLKKAMTWSLLSSVSPSASNAYALAGSDPVTNGYQGDTSINHLLPVLCINKNNPADPGVDVLGSPAQTPGGAWTHTWSAGTVALTAPVLGTTLTSLTVANDLCAAQLGPGYRMAEFHDGDPGLWSGWDFWGAVLDANLGPFQKTRFWVSINDQNANPW